MINLTDQEREKFGLYLKQEAHNDAIMLEQLEKIPGGTMPAVVTKYKTEIAAASIISMRLLNTHSDTIGG